MVRVRRGHVDGHPAGSVLEYDEETEARLVAMGLCEPLDGQGEEPAEDGPAHAGRKPKRASKKQRLAARAAELGVEVPDGATAAEIGALVEEAEADEEPPKLTAEVPE